MMPLEEWRPVTCAPEHYEVSSFGRVRRAIYSKPQHGATVGKVIRPVANKKRGGYLLVNMSVDGKQVSEWVAILVAKAFLGPRPSSSHTVNHIDGVVVNNHLGNLEWATYLEQVEHERRLGHLDPYGVRKSNRRGTNHWRHQQ